MGWSHRPKGLFGVWLTAVVIGSLIMPLVGCGGDGPTLYPVSGSVTYKGAPVPAGSVLFTSTAGESLPDAMAPIKDGKYATLEGRGFAGGPCKVRILGFDGVEQGDNMDGSPLFEPYETQIELPKEATAHDFEVPK